MHRLLSHLRAGALNNLWANFRLYEACAGLPPAELAAERVSFFPSILLTLNHVLIVDWYYIDALTAGGRGMSSYADEVPFTGFGALRAAQTASDRKLIAFCDALDAAALDAAVTLERVDGPRRETVEAVLGHLYQHQIHHRGQVHAMLSGTHVAPPQLDEFYLEQDRPLRIAELRVLGID